MLSVSHMMSVPRVRRLEGTLGNRLANVIDVVVVFCHSGCVDLHCTSRTFHSKSSRSVLHQGSPPEPVAGSLHERMRPVGSNRECCDHKVRQPKELLPVVRRQLLATLPDGLEWHDACAPFDLLKILRLPFMSMSSFVCGCSPCDETRKQENRSGFSMRITWGDQIST